jgi:hypothetical protein
VMSQPYAACRRSCLPAGDSGLLAPDIWSWRVSTREAAPAVRRCGSESRHGVLRAACRGSGATGRHSLLFRGASGDPSRATDRLSGMRVCPVGGFHAGRIGGGTAIIWHGAGAGGPAQPQIAPTVSNVAKIAHFALENGNV